MGDFWEVQYKNTIAILAQDVGETQPDSNGCAL